MAKIFMGLLENNKEVKLTKDFKVELKDTEYPNGYITHDDCIQLDIGNDNLACIFPTRTGVNRVMLDLILQENKKNIVVFDINGFFLKETADKKLRNGYEVIAIKPLQDNHEKEMAILNVKNANKFAIYIYIDARYIKIGAKDPIISFLFNELKNKDLLTIFDESSAFLDSGMLFLDKMINCYNNQIIFRFQSEDIISLNVSEELKNNWEKAGLNKKLFLETFKNMNLLKVPLDNTENYVFENKNTDKITILKAPIFKEVYAYLDRYL